MLKGVGRVYYRQHLQQAAVGLLTCHSITHETIQPAIRTKSSTSTSVAHSTNPGALHCNAEDSPSRPLLDTTSSWLRKRSTKPGQPETKATIKPSRKQPPATHNFSHLPLEVAQMIDSLFAKRSQVSMLKYLRSSTVSDHFIDRTKAIKLAEAMVHTRFPQRAYQVLLLAHKLGCPLKQNAYHCVAYQLAEVKHWHLIPPLVALGKRQTGRTTVRLLNWRTRAIIESGHYERLVNVLDDFELENLKPNQRTFHLLVSGHLRNHNLRLARECLKKMEEAGIPADATTHSTVASVYRSLGPATDVQDYAFETLRDVSGRTSSIVLNNLMQLYMDVNYVSGILRVLSLFHQGDADVTLSDALERRFLRRSGNTSLDHHSVAPEALGTSSHSPQAPVMPDVATFTILINYMAGRHDLPGVLWIFERMSTANVRPDAAAAAALLRAYFRGGQEGIAVSIVFDMCHRHDVPRSLFNSLGLTSEPPNKLPFRFSDIPLTAEVFNALMRNALNTRGLRGARTVLRIMYACNVKPDTKTIEILMAHLDYVKSARPRDLIRVLRNLSSATAPPTLSHVHIIMRSVLRREKFLLLGSGWDVTAAKFSRSRRDLSRYPEGRISGIADSFDPTAGIELPRKLSYRALIQPIVQSLSSRHIMSNRTTIALRLKHEAVTKSDLTTAKNVFQEMLARGMRPTIHHFTALMEGHALSGDLRSAKNIMGSALSAGIHANVVMFTILIVGHARVGHPDKAMRTFQGMITAGIRPDVPAVDAVASAYFAVGAYKIAKRVLSALWPHVRAPPEGIQEAATLKQLARAFRVRHANRDLGDHPKCLSKSEQMVLRWKINRLIKAWKRIGRPFKEHSLWENIRKRRLKTSDGPRT